MIRVLSALLLLPLVLGIVWFLPPIGTLTLATIASLLAFHELAALAAALGMQIPRGLGSVSVAAACVAVGVGVVPVDIVLLVALVLIGFLMVATGTPGAAAMSASAVFIFAIVYIGLPLGAIAAIHAEAGREALLLLVVTIIASDSAQYYTGRALGRSPLAPAISPKKTREGAIGGVVVGALVMIAGGRLVFVGVPIALLSFAAIAVVLSGIVGDLFESLLKRSAGVKDSSQLIPGHGGMLDRIDSWLFAGPAFYLLVRYLQL